MVDIEVILFGLVLFQSGYFLLNLVELLVHKLDQLGVMSGKGVGARFLARACFEIVLLAPCTAGCLVDKEALDKAARRTRLDSGENRLIAWWKLTWWGLTHGRNV